MYYDDSVIEQSTVRKLLRHLLPLLCLLSMATVLDRLNLGYAAPAMDPALRLTQAQLHTADGAFCAGTLLAALPAAWWMLRSGARRWIAGTVLAWATIAIAHGLVWNAGSLYAVRFLLGAAEANLLPAMIFYLSEWLPGRHRTTAIAALIAAASLVPVLGDQGSNLLLFSGRYFGITDWRWLFVVEGLPALWLGLHVLSELPATLADAKWLFPAERHWLKAQPGWDALPAQAGFTDGLRRPALWKLLAVRVVIALVAGSLDLWVPLAMQQTLYLPPVAGVAIMTIASLLGAGGAAAVGWRWTSRDQWRRALAGCLGLAGLCLALAGLVPAGALAVLTLAVVAALAPAALALTWVLGPSLVAGAAAASGLALLGTGGVLGDLASGVLTAVQPDSVQCCLVLAASCWVASWLAWRLTHEQTVAAAAGSAV